MLKPGTIIDGRYEILELLGSGGFGSVYKAFHTQLDRQVAIKVLDSSQVHDEENLGRFHREAKTVSVLEHPGIVKCYGYGIIDNAPYMVLELLQGTPLEHKPKPMAAEQAVEIMKLVFEALAYAHDHGVVHRDVKPANIMIMPDGTIKIIDFGLVKLLPGSGVTSQKLTETGYALGTCHYMAPEQALGGTTDGRADIYSCGCILYELITGQVPFDADDHLAMLQKHLNEDPKPISAFLPVEHTYYSSLANVIETCMQKDPTQRYADCHQVLSDLESLHAGTIKRMSPPMVRLRRTVRNNKKKLLKALTLLVGAVAVFATLDFVSNHVEQQDKVKAVTNFPRTSQELLANFNRKLWKGEPRESIDAGAAALAQDANDHLLTNQERFCALVNIADRCRDLSQQTEFRSYVDKALAVYPSCEQQLKKETENDRQLECWLKFAEMLQSTYGWDEAIKVYEPLMQTGKFRYAHAMKRASMASYYLSKNQLNKAQQILAPLQTAAYMESASDKPSEVAIALAVSSDLSIRKHDFARAYEFAKTALDYDPSNADANRLAQQALSLRSRRGAALQRPVLSPTKQQRPQ